MELTSNKTLTTIVRERRLMPRLRLLTRVDITVSGSGDLYWGSMLNLSRTGVAVVLRHHLKTNQRVTIRFHFQSLDGREVVEELIAKAIWQCGDNTGLEFETPLTTGSPALQKARFLMTNLEAIEAGR
jgi:PilZ domain